MYTLTRDAYISDNGETYQAQGVDNQGNDVMVYWDIINMDDPDESNACDWSIVKFVKRLDK